MTDTTPMQAAPTVVDREENESSSSPLITRLELIGISIFVLLFLAQAFWIIRKGAPFGHEEAVYSLRARDFVAGRDPLFYWDAYRAPGLPVLLTPMSYIRATEPYLRAVVAGFGGMFIVATWWLGRTMFDRRTGLIAAAAMAITPAILSASTNVFPDIPGAALTTLTLALYAWALDRRNLVPWTATAVAVLIGVTTLVRFGAPVPLAVGLVGLTLWRWEVAVENWRIVALTAVLSGLAVGAVALIPQATSWSHSSLTDSTSPLNAFRELRSGTSWTGGFLDYIELRHRLINGFPRIVLLFGIMISVIGAVQRKINRRTLVTVLSIGVLMTVALAASVHGEPRYLTPAYPWFWVGAAAGIAYVTRAWTPAVSIAVLLLSAYLIIPASWWSSEEKSRWNIINDSTITSAALLIDAASEDYECTVVTTFAPVVEWYSKCWTMTYDLESVSTTHPLLPNGDRFLITEEAGRRQASGPLLDEYIEQGGDLFAELGSPGDGRNYIKIYRVSSEG